MEKTKKCIVMFSGGLDSRLAVKLMQEKGFDPLLVYFNLPFGSGCCSERCSFSFSQVQGLKIKVFDCTKAKLFKEYLDVIKKAKHGRGAGVNPCIDCRLFMFKKTKEFADKEGIKIIATGEVTGQRPMSQQKKQIEIIEKEAGLKARVVRPLIDLGFHGRRRDKQIELARKFKIKYPSPGGGCILCEKALKKRFQYLLKRGISEEELPLVNLGRHFIINDCWVVIGRDEKENKVIESYKGHIEPGFLGPSAVILAKCNRGVKEKVNELIKSYSKKGRLKERKKFDKYKL
jgi:predicted subunit of tRNA(5-methylaminomethyl-2-thiouridylate) methyltransferase